MKKRKLLSSLQIVIITMLLILTIMILLNNNNDIINDNTSNKDNVILDDINRIQSHKDVIINDYTTVANTMHDIKTSTNGGSSSSSTASSSSTSISSTSSSSSSSSTSTGSISSSNRIDLSNLKNNEIGILQYDSRPLADYWLSSSLWNDYYCKKHGHNFLYYTIPMKDNHQSNSCRHNNELLASPWCKVLSMIQATIDYPNIKVFIYLDSDAIIDRRFENTSVTSFLSIMQSKLDWDPAVKPIVFNQDGPSWWCQLISNIGYKMCLNAGTVLWYRHTNSMNVLKYWWNSAMDSYTNNPIKRPFRLKWPWEQDRQMAIYNNSNIQQYIQVASQPYQSKMDHKIGIKDWCLSHLPKQGCFISHHCENRNSKNNLIKLYTINDNYNYHNKKYDFHVNYLRLDDSY